MTMRIANAYTFFVLTIKPISLDCLTRHSLLDIKLAIKGARNSNIDFNVDKVANKILHINAQHLVLYLENIDIPRLTCLYCDFCFITYWQFETVRNGKVSTEGAWTKRFLEVVETLSRTDFNIFFKKKSGLMFDVAQHAFNANKCKP